MLSRRTSLLLPLLLAACGGEEKHNFAPLHYGYLLPLQLNVGTIQIEQRFIPSGVPPDVSQYAPNPPVQALRAMAEDRLQALGSADLAVFIIQDASLVRRRDTITGNFAVELDIFNGPNQRAAFARASVSGSFSGDLDDLPARLYEMTRNMMDRMNVEFEFQVRKSLGSWLVSGSAVRQPVEQQPLTATPSGTSLPPPTPMMQTR